MSNIEYHINYQFDGAVQWLESRNGGYSEAEKLLNASIVICQNINNEARPKKTNRLYILIWTALNI